MRTEPSFPTDPDHNLLDDVDHSVGASGTQFDVESQSLSDYRQRYGLSADPFVDDPHFPFYSGGQRRQILDQLLHLCQFSYNILLVAGEYGVGKTRMAQALIDALDDIDDICFVEGQINSNLDSLFADVCEQFELSSQLEFTEFCRKNSEQDGLVVLIVDNAHHLTDSVITELFHVLQENQASRLHLVLFAEPHLLGRLENINAPDLVLTDVLLEKFALDEAVDYLNFRMEMADYLGPEVFAANHVESWWRESQGQLLSLHEYAQEKLLASVASAKSFTSTKSGQLVPHIVVASVLAGGLLFGYFYWGGDTSPKDVNSMVSAPASVEPLTHTEAATISMAANNASVAYKSAELDRSVEVSSAAALSNADPVVKQRVVPLVQANSLDDSALLKQQQVGAQQSANVRTSTASSAPHVVTLPNNKAADVNVAKPSSSLSVQEKAILAWDASEFTLQLVGLSSESAALDFIAEQSNKKDLMLFRSLRQGKDWFVVVTGHFPSSSKARQAAQNLPDSQKTASPWPREVKVIQQEIKQRR